jgi:hypothetical protein
MTIGTRDDKRQGMGRLYVLGGFTLVEPTRAPGGHAIDVDPQRKRDSPRVWIVRDGGQEASNMATPAEVSECPATERGEDRAMSMADSETCLAAHARDGEVSGKPTPRNRKPRS